MGKIILSCISFASRYATAFHDLLCYRAVPHHGLREQLEKTAGNLHDFCSHLRMGMGAWGKEELLWSVVLRLGGLGKKGD